MATPNEPVSPRNDPYMGLGAGRSDWSEIASEPDPQPLPAFKFDVALPTYRLGRTSPEARKGWPIALTGAFIVTWLLVMLVLPAFAVTLLLIVLWAVWLAGGWLLCAMGLGVAFRENLFIPKWWLVAILALLPLIYPALVTLLIWWIGGLPKDIESVKLLLVIFGIPWVVLFALSIYVFCKPSLLHQL